MSFELYLTGQKAKPLVSKKQIEEQEGQDSESRYLEAMRKADMGEETEW